MKFYQDKVDGSILFYLTPPEKVSGNLVEVIPGTVDASVEKHLPAVAVEGNKICVEVGSVAHPMSDAHYIQWIVLETDNGFQSACLSPSDSPKAEFVLADGIKPISAFAYCNLHGLWQAAI